MTFWSPAFSLRSGPVNRTDISSGELTLFSTLASCRNMTKCCGDPNSGSNGQGHRILDYIEHSGDLVASSPFSDPLPDPDDHPFLEVALAGRAACLVTGNHAHFPPDAARKSKCSRPPSSSHSIETSRNNLDETRRPEGTGRDAAEAYRKGRLRKPRQDDRGRGSVEA